MNYNEIEGNLITLAQEGSFDVIAHGCNCFCRMGAGIAPQMASAFKCDLYPLEQDHFRGDIKKLGNIEYQHKLVPRRGSENNFRKLYVVNAYTQYTYDRNNPLDYEAFTLCMRKMNKIFQGKHIGLPLIGCGLAGGDWDKVKEIIQTELSDCVVTIVFYKK